MYEHEPTPNSVLVSQVEKFNLSSGKNGVISIQESMHQSYIYGYIYRITFLVQNHQPCACAMILYDI